jgi:hypothetical protein
MTVRIWRRLTLIMLVFAFGITRADESSPAWSVEGQWLDACNCSMPCPCWKSQMPTLKSCQDLFYFHITKGSYGSLKLDGIDVVEVGLTAAGKTMDQSNADKDWVFANVYVPKTLSAEAVAAVEKIFTEQLTIVPPGSAKKHSLKRVEMTASMTDKGAKVKIPHVLDLEVEKTAKAYPYDTKVVSFAGDGRVGAQHRYDFNDDGQSWKLKDRNASFSPFSWSSAKAAAAKK